MSNEQTTAAAPAKKGRSKLLVIGIPLVLVLAGGAGGGFWYVKARAASTDKKVEEPEPTGLLTLDPFTVNLADPGGRRYLRVALQLVVDDPEVVKQAEEEVLEMSRMRSSILEVLAKRTAAQLTTPEGRTELKHEIAEVSTHVGHMKVHDVLLQEFVVQ